MKEAEIGTNGLVCLLALGIILTPLAVDWHAATVFFITIQNTTAFDYSAFDNNLSKKIILSPQLEVYG